MRQGRGEFGQRRLDRRHGLRPGGVEGDRGTDRGDDPFPQPQARHGLPTGRRLRLGIVIQQRQIDIMAARQAIRPIGGAGGAAMARRLACLLGAETGQFRACSSGSAS